MRAASRSAPARSATKPRYRRSAAMGGRCTAFA